MRIVLMRRGSMVVVGGWDWWCGLVGWVGGGGGERSWRCGLEMRG